MSLQIIVFAPLSIALPMNSLPSILVPEIAINKSLLPISRESK